jgi:hypothetical protein
MLYTATATVCLYRYTGCWDEASGRCCGSELRGMSSYGLVSPHPVSYVHYLSRRRKLSPSGRCQRRIWGEGKAYASLQTGKDKNYGGDRSLLVFGRLDGGGSSRLSSISLSRLVWISWAAGVDLFRAVVVYVHS